jgi:acetyltransferase-like isoleucine patch superfamily enzyme
MKQLFFWVSKQCLFLVLRIFPTEAFIRLVPFLSSRLVVACLRFYGADIGDNVRFSLPVTFHGVDNYDRHPFSNLTIEDDVYIGRQVFLDCEDVIHIEKGSTLAMGVMVITHTNAGNSPLSELTLPVSHAPVHIKAGTYVGARAIILQGVTLGEKCLVAAGAVVINAVESEAVVGGVPAKALDR